MKLKGHIIFLLLFAYFNAFTQNTENPFFNDILRFKEIDKILPPPQDAILLIGSSSFTMWQDVQEYFPEFIIINRGFGGSTLVDQIRYVEDIVFPYSPKQIIIYCGENDLASSDTINSEIVIQRFRILFDLIRAKFPDVMISYISMKPSPLRWHLSKEFREANKGIQNFIESKSNANFINIWDNMLDTNFMPDKSMFLEDRLHMNPKGYIIWQKAIESLLVN